MCFTVSKFYLEKKSHLEKTGFNLKSAIISCMTLRKLLNLPESVYL